MITRRASWKALHQGMAPMGGELALYVNVTVNARRATWTTSAKVLGDALNGVGHGTTIQVVEPYMWRHDDPKEPTRAEVELPNNDAITKGAC